MKKVKVSKNILLLLGIMIAITIMGIGYASVESITGEIGGKIIASAQEGVFITNAEYVSNVGANVTNSQIKNYVKTTLQSTVELSSTNAESSITYKVTVFNNSDDYYEFTEVKYDSEFYDNENITFEVTGFVPSERIKPKETKDIVVTFKYKDTTSVPSNRTLNSYLNFNMEKALVTTAGTYLPTGFTQVEGTTLENGLTIQDSKGNQYVWVEVPQTTEVYSYLGLTEFSDYEYSKIEYDLINYSSYYRRTNWEDKYSLDEATGLTSEQYTALKQKMLKSVYQNGGFYVGKYETGIENKPKTDGSESTTPTEIPVIKQNAYPYNYVTCKQAQTLASNMESGSYNTSLMFGLQWDLILKYLEKKGTTQADLKTDSTTWGNYSNNLWNITNEKSKYAVLNKTTYMYEWTSGPYGVKSSSTGVPLSTGASDTFCKQGIYDLAGNVYEFTLESTEYSSSPCAARGGSYSNDGSFGPAWYRISSATYFYNTSIGFRVALY